MGEPSPDPENYDPDSTILPTPGTTKDALSDLPDLPSDSGFAFPDIDGFVIESVLGKGAHGVVFKAIDMSLKKPVAIKVLNRLASQEESLRERFLREIKAYHSLRDGHIIQLRNHGEISRGPFRGCPFVIMEFMDGGTFGRWLHQKPNNAKGRLRAGVEILVEVCKGLSYLHKQDLVHRDLKPDNILLAELNDETGVPGQVRLSDFGLIADLNENRELSATGMWMGTLAYMSPEQFQDSKNVTPASDQYAVGIMLHQLLCGRRPWQTSADVQEPAGLLEAKAQVKTPCPPPPTGSRNSGLREICIRCVDPDSRERYENVDQLRESLEAWLHGEMDPHSRSWLKRTWRTGILHPIRRRPGRVFAAVAAISLLAPWGYWMSLEYSRAAEQALISKQEAEEREAQSRVRALQQATPQVAATMLQTEDFSTPIMKQALQDQFTKNDLSEQEIFRTRLGILAHDPAQIGPILDFVKGQLTQPRSFGELKLAHNHIRSLQQIPFEFSRDILATPGERLAGAYLLAETDVDASVWEEHISSVASELVQVDPLYLSSYASALYPIRDLLNGPLSEIFKNQQTSVTVRDITASLLANYSSDNVSRLCDISLEASPNGYRFLLPLLSSAENAEDSKDLMEEILTDSPSIIWPREPDLADWEQPPEKLVTEFAKANGILDDRWAYCASIDVLRFVEIAEALRPAGYRPIRVRPHRPLQFAEAERKGPNYLVAAVWARDGQNFKIDLQLTEDEIPNYDPTQPERLNAEFAKSKDGLLLQDLSAIPVTEGGLKPKFLALWSEASRMDQELSPELQKPTTVDMAPTDANRDTAEWLLGSIYSAMLAEKRFAVLDLREEDFAAALQAINQDLHKGLRIPGFINSLSVRTDHEGNRRYTGILGSLTAGTGREKEYRDSINISSTQMDIAISPLNSDPLQIYRENLAFLKGQPEDQQTAPELLSYKAKALFQLGEIEQSQRTLDAIGGENDLSAELLYYRAWILARLGEVDAANEAMTLYLIDNEDSLEWQTCVRINFLGWLGEFEEARNLLEKGSSEKNIQPHEVYNLACSAAVCAQAANNDARLAGRFSDLALSLLDRALGSSQSPYLLPTATDADLQSLYRDSRFFKLLKKYYPKAHVAGIFRQSYPMESQRIVASSALELETEVATQVQMGWRPIAIAVGDSHQPQYIATQMPVETNWAVVLQRPAFKLEDAIDLTERKAMAALTLIRMNACSRLPDSFYQTSDLSVRKHTLSRLADYGVSCESILFNLENARDGNQRVFFVLAIGELASRLSEDERITAIDRLRSIYRTNPHSGTHSAARWSLGQIGESLLTGQIDHGNRGTAEPQNDWLVNKAGQTMIRIHQGIGLQGSPQTELGRSEAEILHQTTMGHDFWISATEVTKSDWIDFSEEIPEVISFADENISSYMTSPDSPIIGITWDEAALYCNWLSEQEGIPREQWCYEQPNNLQEGMTVKPNFQNLLGYRLPTEAEWEYACRAGSRTAFNFGNSEQLLGLYARYIKNSDGTCGPVDALRPNESGLFGMHGNAAEWCQDTPFSYVVYPVTDPTVVEGGSERISRGGSWNSHATSCRSASRGQSQIDRRFYDTGFRIVRTQKPSSNAN